MKSAAAAFVFLLGLCSQGVFTAQVDVIHKDVTVLPGQNATFICHVGVELQYCRVEIPGMSTLNLNRNLQNSEVSYYGNGLERGDCGFTIHRVNDMNNGQIKCTLGTKNEATESVGVMQLTVAKAPKLPELDLSMGHDSVNVYKVGDKLRASCIVRDGRPVANISWYLDDEPIDRGQLNEPDLVALAKENLQTKMQNLTRDLRVTDNAKYLRCVAYHPAYPNGFAESKRQLDIKFAPLSPDEQPIEKFGYEINQVGVINVTIEANPKPHIEWSIDGQTIREGGHDNSGTVEAEEPIELGKGKYLVNLRIARITKQDTEKDYILYAYNDLGNQEYKIRISTNAESKGFELGIASIIGIVVVVLFVILVASIIIFARVTGKWCFSGMQDDTRHIGESSDTESADVRPKETKRRLPPLKLTSLFKKSKESGETISEAPVDVETGITSEPPLETDLKESIENLSEKQGEKDKEKDKEGLVYAELDLVSPSTNLKPVVKNDDEKTEYAEIVYTPTSETRNKENEKEVHKVEKDGKKK